MQIDYVINPERTVAKVIDYTISLPNAARAQFFSSKKLEMIELHLKQDSMFDGISVIEARSRTKAQFLICGVLRNGDFYIPNGSFTLCAGDRIGITATPENFELLLSDMGYSVKGKKGTTLIAGGSRVAYYLAKQLSKNKRGCIIFEKDSAVCCQLENELGSIAQIINADGSDRDTLNEYGLEEANAFVSLTGFDEENILMSYYAHSVGVPNVIAKVNRYEMMSTAEKIGVDNVVNPRIIVSDMVKRYARGLENTIDSGVETLYSLFDFQAEALEFIVGSAFTQTGVKISKLKLKKDIIIAGIVRNNRTIIPGGDDTIEPEDRVAIVTKLKHLDNLNSILR